MEFRDSSGQLIRTRSRPLFTTPQAEGAAMKTLIDTGFETIKAHDNTKTYGCDDCEYLKGNHCKLWQVKVIEPANSHCESYAIKES